MLNGARILITGGAGFIGSATAATLLDHGNDVFAVDNFRRNALQHRIKQVPVLEKMSVYNADILDLAELQRLIREIKPTHIVHAAAVAGIDTVVLKPVSTLEINALGTMNVLKAALDAPDLQRIVTFSTSEIFGPQAFNSNENSASVIGSVGEARWSYAVSKLAGEHMTLAYHSQHGMPSTVLRPFNVYGPGQVGEGALSIFIQRALQDQNLQIHGDGTQIRAWCYIDDMVSGVIAALCHEGAVGKAFNIGNPRAVTTIYGLANSVIRLLNSRSQIEFVRKDYADIELRIPDAQWARTEIGFSAEVDLEQGIPLAAEFYREKLGLS
jgi:UDP-glucose 4-epimerase